jgi:hypothetical protein
MGGVESIPRAVHISHPAHKQGPVLVVRLDAIDVNNRYLSGVSDRIDRILVV